MRVDPNLPEFDWPQAVGEPAREVWYSLVNPTEASVAFWYRYTLLSTVSGYREGRLWAALTDRENPANSTFVSRSVPMENVDVGAEPFSLSLHSSELTSASATGTIEDISWDLSYDPDVYAFTPLRSQRLTDLLMKVQGTGKHWSRNESVFMTGEVTVGDRTIELEDAPGHQGHTVSSLSPPDDWTWVHCNDFDEPVVFEALKLDDVLSMCLRVEGGIYPLNRVHQVLPGSPWSNETVRDEVGRCQFRGAGEGIELEVELESSGDHWQHVRYRVPDDTMRYNAHDSLCDITVRYELDGRTRTVTSDAARAEWVSVDPSRDGDYQPTWE